jgi:hypothetical protein
MTEAQINPSILSDITPIVSKMSGDPEMIDTLIRNRESYTLYNGEYFDYTGQYVGDDLPESLFPGVLRAVGLVCISILRCRDLGLRMTARRMIEFQLMVRRHCGYTDGISSFDFPQEFIDETHVLVKEICNRCFVVFGSTKTDVRMDSVDLKIQSDYIQKQIALSMFPITVMGKRITYYTKERFALEGMLDDADWFLIPVIGKRLENLVSGRGMRVGVMVLNRPGFRGDYKIKTPDSCIDPVRNPADTSVIGKYYLTMELDSIAEDGDYAFIFNCIPWSMFSIPAEHKMFSIPAEHKEEVNDVKMVIVNESPGTSVSRTVDDALRDLREFYGN